MPRIIILLLSIYSTFFVICAILAPISAHFHFYELSAKCTELLMFSCHQKPDKSFWIFGYPMALCCRCFGFYLGFSISGFYYFIKHPKINWKILSVIFVIAVTDLAINYIFKITTWNISRFMSGICLSILAIYIIKYLTGFERRKDEKSN